MKTTAVSKILQAVTGGVGTWDADERVNSAGTWTMVSCPLAKWEHDSGHDYNPSFSINVEPGNSMCKCLSCGFTGPLTNVVKKIKQLGGIDENVEEELQRFIEYEARVGFDVEENTYIPLLPNFFTDDFNRMHAYTRSRGLDETDMHKWALGFSNDLERVLIPFYDSDNSLVAVVGRDVTNEHPQKYMVYPKGFKRGKYLFGENKLRGDEEAVLVVEGYLDCVIASKYLPDNIGVVAIGTAIPTIPQLRHIVALAPEIILGLDNPKEDMAGLKGYLAAKAYIRGRCKLTELDYRQFKDAGEAGEKIAVIVEHRIGNTLLRELESRLTEIRKRLTKDSQ